MMNRILSATQKAAVLEPVAETLPEEVEYPTSDGVAFAETPWHAHAKASAYSILEQHFVGRFGVFVGCDSLMFYEKDNPRAFLAPDVYVAFDVGSQNDREGYRIWEEGKPPDFVLEVVSRSTLQRDLTTKKDLYATIGVPEHWLLDPRGLIRGEPLAGSWLSGGVYHPITPVESADGRARLPSEVLGLHLGTKQEGYISVAEFWDPESGSPVLKRSELSQAYTGAKEQLARSEKMLARSEKMLAAERQARLNERRARLDERAKRIRAEKRAEELVARLAESTRRDDSNS